MKEIILPWDERLVKTNPDIELSNILSDNWFTLEQSIKELALLMEDTKDKNTSEDRKLRMEIIKHAQALHWSKASLRNINIWIFIHDSPNKPLRY